MQTIILVIMAVDNIVFIFTLLSCLVYNTPRVTHVTGIIGKAHYVFPYVHFCVTTHFPLIKQLP